LIRPQVLDELPVGKDIAVMAADRKHRIPGSARLQRHDRALLFGELICCAQKRQDVRLADLQLGPEVRAQDSGLRAAAQLIAFRPDPNIATSQLGKKFSDGLNARSGTRRICITLQRFLWHGVRFSVTRDRVHWTFDQISISSRSPPRSPSSAISD
jgi:hypothetical protein